MSTTFSEQSAQPILASPSEVAIDRPATPAMLTIMKVSWVLFVLVTGSFILAMNEADPDLWGHTLYGKDWIETGRLAKTTTGSFTSIGFRWINHENLAELLTAWTEMKFGPQGLLTGKFLLGVFVQGLMLFQARRHGVGWGFAGVCTLLAASGLAFHWHFRPQVLGYTMFSVMLVSLSWIFEGWEGRWNLRPWKSPPLELDEGVEYRWPHQRCERQHQSHHWL